jgi:hypothetical protein
MRVARLRNHLHYWRGWVEAKALLFRIFYAAELCWEEMEGNKYSSEYRALSESWKRWMRVVQQERLLRIERVGEEVRTNNSLLAKGWGLIVR